MKPVFTEPRFPGQVGGWNTLSDAALEQLQCFFVSD